MQLNVYDKACRYLAKLDPPGFLAWLLGLQTHEFSFQKWLDPRAIALPDECERTADLAAHLHNLLDQGIPWALVVEFQIEPDAVMFGRLLRLLGAIWQYTKPDEERGSRYHVSAAVVNLTGQGQCSQPMRWPAARLTTELQIVERNLEFERAEELLAGVESGRWPRSLLGFIPLMIGGGESDIIERWKLLAAAEPNNRSRGDYGSIALQMADRVNRGEIWGEKLKGWNMTESPFINEFIALGRAEGRVEGRAEGEAKSRVEEARSVILQFGAKRFGPATAEIESAVLSLGDYERLKRIRDRLLDAADWSDLLATP
jgi:hypothetical protein